jgi:HSP20 family molecular chaperone IbpA
MSLFRRDPFINDFFGPQFGPSLALRQAPSPAHHHIYQTDDSVTLSIDVPGIKSNDLQIQFEDNVLRVSGERKTAGSESKFVRSFSMDPKNVDVDSIKANLDCGVLTLTVPKRTKPVVSKTITVTESNVIKSQPLPVNNTTAPIL